MALFEGEGEGNHGKITVAVTVKGGKVADVKGLEAHRNRHMIIQAPIDNPDP